MQAGNYTFLLFLTLLNVMNIVDRQLLGSFANFIVPDLGLTNTQFGLLTGLFFIVVYSGAGLFMGALADRVNRTRLIALGLALWSALTMLSGAARGFWTMAAPRMLIGVGESIMSPTAISLLSDRFSGDRMGFAAGFYYLGVPVGVGVSLLVAGYLGPAIGWRNCFYLLGAIGLALALVMWRIQDTPRRHAQEPKPTDPAEPAQRQGAPLSHAPQQTQPTPHTPSFQEIFSTLWSALRTCPALALTIAGGVVSHFILGAAVFDQLWYVQERGFERAEIARITGWVGLAGGVLGNLFGGLGSDRFLIRTGVGRPMFLFWVALVLAPTGVAYRLVDPASLWFWIGIFFGFFQLGCFYGPTFSTVQELVPPSIRATVVAFYILMLNVIGLGVGVTAGGFMIDELLARGVAAPYTLTLLIFTLVSLAAVPLYYLAGRRYRQDRARLMALAGT